MEIILEFDDFCEGSLLNKSCDRLDLLLDLKKSIPELKITLFTVLGRCSMNWIREMKSIPWIDMCPHGWLHFGEEACVTKKEATDYLDRIEPFKLTKVFKAPGWRISDQFCEALRERGYWLADLPDKKRPAGLKTYIAGQEGRIKGHILECLGDKGLEKRFEFYAGLKGNFKFIKDIL